MDDLGGRYASYAERLVASVTDAPGHTPGELRRAVFARAARLDGAAERPVRTSPEVPPTLAAFADKVARHAYRVTDDDVAALQRAGNSDDAIFEITIAAALGAALGRLERGLAALRGEPSPPVPVSAMRSPPLTPSPFGRGGTQE